METKRQNQSECPIVRNIFEKMKKLLKIRSRRQALKYILTILICSYLYTLSVRMRCTEKYRNYKKRISMNTLKIPDDVLCYHERNPIDEMKFIKKNAVYLISASCDSSISVHQACVIESVMHSHAYDVKVFVFFTKPVEECNCNENIIRGLVGLPSLHFINIQIDKFVEETPLKGVFNGNFLKKGMKKHSRVAEYLKFAALYKFGGVVLDLDIIMARPVQYLGANWGVRINGSQLGSAAIALDSKTHIGRSLLVRALQLLKAQRNQEDIDGGLALTEAFRQLCYEHPAKGCPSFRIYDADLFYPYNRTNGHMIFNRGNLQARAYGYYVWDRTETRRYSGSVYTQLMREYCPNTASYFNI